MDHCLRHMEESASGECRSCHGQFCTRCLVYSFGPKKPPFCVGCALHASGVRTGARRSYQPRTSQPAAEVGTFAGAPSLFSDDTRGGPPAPPTNPAGTAKPATVKMSWSERRAQRQAAKAQRSASSTPPRPDTAGPAMPGPLDGPVEQLEPVLSANQRRALGRLSAGSFARS